MNVQYGNVSGGSATLEPCGTGCLLTVRDAGNRTRWISTYHTRHQAEDDLISRWSGLWFIYSQLTQQTALSGMQ